LVKRAGYQNAAKPRGYIEEHLTKLFACSSLPIAILEKAMRHVTESEDDITGLRI